MKRIKEWFVNEEKRSVMLLIISGISLVVSFFDIGHLPVNAAWVAIALCGIPILLEAAEGLITRFDIKADVLVSLALIASVVIGEIFAAGEVAFIMQIGSLLEQRTVAKARAGIEKLIKLTPRTARVVRADSEQIIPAEQVRIGDTLRVLAGETIAVDGIITGGNTSVNQAVMTGESLPIDKKAGDEVFSGTVNQFGTFEMQAMKEEKDSSLQRMIRLVESADAGKAKIVGLADRWATWIVVTALVSAALTWIVTGEVIRAVTILVVFCPCALVLATPTAIMAGIGNATKYGILVRQGDALERLAAVKHIAFDKTGTLTVGKPSVTAVETFEAVDKKELLALAASAELRSEHPLGKAVAAYYKETCHTLPPQPSQFDLLAGRGVKAMVNGRMVLAGNVELLTEQGLSIPESLNEKARSRRSEGSTIIYIVVNRQTAGFIALTDTLRPDAAEIIHKLKQAGVKPALLTGDHMQAAAHIARKAGITDIHAECLPEDKLKAIDDIQQKGEQVCMVGDGINDAPALKKAYVGIAMGGIGSDIAVEAADIALVSDDIKHLPHLLGLAQKTMRTIKINLILSMLLNFAAILLAMTGILNPVVGALVHNVGSVVVIINSALLLTWKKK